MHRDGCFTTDSDNWPQHLWDPAAAGLAVPSRLDDGRSLRRRRHSLTVG